MTPDVAANVGEVSSDPIELDGAVVAITGAGRGIGRGTAIAMRRRGASVILGDIDIDAAEAVAREIGTGAHAHRLDVASRDSFAEFIANAEAVGPLRVLVNNAGVMSIARFVDESDELSRRTIDVNIWGPILGMRLALPAMISRGSGHIVNVASVMGRIHEPGLAVYTGSKHAILGMTASVREEVAGTGVTLSAVLPTAVRTELTAGLPLDRLFPIDPDEVARAIVGTCATRTPEIWVPRWLRAYELIAALAPRPVMRILRRLFGGNRALVAVGSAARASYDERLARQRSDAERFAGAATDPSSDG